MPRFITAAAQDRHGRLRKYAEMEIGSSASKAQWEDRYRFADDLRAKGWTAQEIYASHAPDGTSADFIYHLYQLDRPDY
jgi:hypothetical protein